MADNIELKNVDINSIDVNNIFCDVSVSFRKKLVTTLNIIKEHQHLIPIVKVNVYNVELVNLLLDAGLNIDDEGNRLSGDFYVPLCFRCACILNGCYDVVFPQEKSS
jgi:hypothetical protein